MANFFAFAVFLGSALLFCVQPMLGRALLPVFGGSSHIWTVCLVVFQSLLLFGAIYADRIVRLGYKWQRGIHLSLIFIAAIWISLFGIFRGPLLDALPLADTTLGECFVAIGAILIAVGLPYIVLGAGSSLVQRWAADCLGSGRETYRLYVISNIGSFVGLLAYPLVIEPFVSQFYQWVGFAICIVVYLLCCLAAFINASSKTIVTNAPEVEVVDDNDGEDLDDNCNNRIGFHFILWLALPALSTAILNATTTHLSTDVSPFPLMWSILLAAFLLSYAIGFSRLGERLLPLWALLSFCTLCFAVAVIESDDGSKGAFTKNFIAGFSLILFCGNFLHSWLCRIRPNVRYLTGYYLCISLGGAIGGILSGILPIVIFDSVVEYPIVLVMAFAAVLVAIKTVLRSTITRSLSYCVKDIDLSGARAWMFLGVLLLVFVFSLQVHRLGKFEKVYLRGRNFYGCYTIARDIIVLDKESRPGLAPPRYPVMVLQNGNTTHGLEPEFEHFKGQPTTYYGELGGGLAFTLHKNYSTTNQPLSVGIVGMGVGTQAYYGRKNDSITFYEIDPDVTAIAQSYFSFLKDSKADVKIVVGDARKALEKEMTQSLPKFDILIIDAYSGDSVPFHLITKQAFELYRARLKSDGILALHISNWHVNLFPICKAASKALQLNAIGITSPSGIFTWTSSWVFLSSEKLANPDGVQIIDWNCVRDVSLPNDDIGSLLPYLRFFE